MNKETKILICTAILAVFSLLLPGGVCISVYAQTTIANDGKVFMDAMAEHFKKYPGSKISLCHLAPQEKTKDGLPSVQTVFEEKSNGTIINYHTVTWVRIDKISTWRISKHVIVPAKEYTGPKNLQTLQSEEIAQALKKPEITIIAMDPDKNGNKQFKFRIDGQDSTPITIDKNLGEDDQDLELAIRTMEAQDRAFFKKNQKYIDNKNWKMIARLLAESPFFDDAAIALYKKEANIPNDELIELEDVRQYALKKVAVTK